MVSGEDAQMIARSVAQILMVIRVEPHEDGGATRRENNIDVYIQL